MVKRKRGSKFYFDNEKKVMKKLGFTPQPGSGSGEVYKEDGENDYALAQLKTTEKQSFKLQLLDIKKLLYHADVAHKIPVFVIEFLGETTLLALRPEDIIQYAECLKGNELKIESEVVPLESELVKHKLIKAAPKVVDINEEEEQEPKEQTLEDVFKAREERKRKEKLRPKRERPKKKL